MMYSNYFSNYYSFKGEYLVTVVIHKSVHTESGSFSFLVYFCDSYSHIYKNLNLVPIHNLGLLDTNDLRTQQTGLLFCDVMNRNSVVFS